MFLIGCLDHVMQLYFMINVLKKLLDVDSMSFLVKFCPLRYSRVIKRQIHQQMMSLEYKES